MALPDLAPLASIFASPTIIKVIHNASFERRVLAKLGFALDGVVDALATSRARHGRDAIGGHALSAVNHRELGLALDKRQQTSNWARRPLSAEQCSYAACDVEVLIPLDGVLRASTGKLRLGQPIGVSAAPT